MTSQLSLFGAPAETPASAEPLRTRAEHVKALIGKLDTIEAKSGHRPSRVFDGFATLAACCCAVGARETEYLEEAKAWTPDQLNLFSEAFGLLVLAMEVGDPFRDVLGDLHMELMGKWDKKFRGSFYTPDEVCELMARMNLAAIPEHRPIRLLEPTAGSGRMILASARVVVEARKLSPRALEVEAWDIDRTAVHLCFINTTLWGIPCSVVHGNTLTLERFSVWVNPFSRLRSSGSAE